MKKIRLHKVRCCAKTPRQASKTQDITGVFLVLLNYLKHVVQKKLLKWLRLMELFRVDGMLRGKKNFITDPERCDEEVHLIPHGKHLLVQIGDLVHKGQHLTEGAADPHELLEILGREKVCDYLTEEIQKVYRLQGVTINDKHIEVIISQMLKVRITDPGDSEFFWGEQV